MRKKYWVFWAFLFIIPALMLTASCTKKVIKDDTTAGDIYEQSKSDSQAATTPYTEDSFDSSSSFDSSNISAVQPDTGMTQAMIAAREKFVNEDIYFDYDRSSLSPEAQRILHKKASWLRKNKGTSVIIEGHCDERGTTEYNLALGDRRGESVKAYLINLGIAPDRMTTISYGEEKPLDRGHNETAWTKNRRAHFIIE